MELINRMRKKDKGFTLVEIIVVLVILAILAAFTIPTMLGFVNDARGKAMIAEAREVYVAAQSTATEYSAATGIGDGALSTALGSFAVATEKAATTPGTTAAAKASAQMAKYIGDDLTIFASAIPSPLLPTSVTTDASAWTVTVGAGGTSALTTAKVNSLVYIKNGYQVTITGGNASVVKLK